MDAAWKKVIAQEEKINDLLDNKFKPGVFSMVQDFLEGRNEQLCTLPEQLMNVEVMNSIAGYK